MQLSVTGKQLDVGDALRSHIEQALPASVAKYFENATDSQVTLSRDGKQFRADITVHAGKRIVIQGHAVAADPYAAFDGATDHVSKRLRRYKRRLRDHHKRSVGHETSERALQYVLAAEPEPPTTTETEAPAENDKPIIVAEAETELETLSVGEAVMRMDLRELSTMMFRNSAHGGLNTVYRRGDGNIGWIDPHVGPASGRKT